MVKLLVMSMLVIFALPVVSEGNAQRGEELNVICSACHGVDGNSLVGAFPSIAGQQPKYLLKQLMDMKSGERSAPLMAGQLDNMTTGDLEDLAAYYAIQEPKGGSAKADLVELGERIYRSGIKRKQIAACTACHLPSGEGSNLAGFPRLAGQWPEYTEAQLKAFRSNERHNDGDAGMMRGTALDLSDNEIAAVASYLYGLR